MKLDGCDRWIATDLAIHTAAETAFCADHQHHRRNGTHTTATTDMSYPLWREAARRKSQCGASRHNLSGLLVLFLGRFGIRLPLSLFAFRQRIHTR